VQLDGLRSSQFQAPDSKKRDLGTSPSNAPSERQTRSDLTREASRSKDNMVARPVLRIRLLQLLQRDAMRCGPGPGYVNRERQLEQPETFRKNPLSRRSLVPRDLQAKTAGSRPNCCRLISLRLISFSYQEPLRRYSDKRSVRPRPASVRSILADGKLMSDLRKRRPPAEGDAKLWGASWRIVTSLWQLLWQHESYMSTFANCTTKT
jgi:hypothetical protein